VVRRPSGTTLILNDLIGNLRRKDGFEGWLLHILGFGSDSPTLATAAKLLMIKSKGELRDQLLEWADRLPLKRILVSHGDPMETDPAGVLRDLARALS
jgi:hypothetical protein